MGEGVESRAGLMCNYSVALSLDLHGDGIKDIEKQSISRELSTSELVFYVNIGSKFSQYRPHQIIRKLLQVQN